MPPREPTGSNDSPLKFSCLIMSQNLIISLSECERLPRGMSEREILGVVFLGSRSHKAGVKEEREMGRRDVQ